MWMKDSLRKNAVLLIIGLLLTCVTGVIVETRLKVLQRAYDNFIMDNRNHYLTCRDLPGKVEVERILEQHADILEQIQQVAPGFVGVEIDSWTCEGKADLLIWYGSHQQRLAIEEIIAGDTFFGIPYRLQNR
jgi:hypothetical protein